MFLGKSHGFSTSTLVYRRIMTIPIFHRNIVPLGVIIQFLAVISPEKRPIPSIHLFIIYYQYILYYSIMFINCYYSLLFIIIHYYSLLFMIIHYYSLLFIIIHDYSLLFIIMHYYSLLCIIIVVYYYYLLSLSLSLSLINIYIYHICSWVKSPKSSPKGFESTFFFKCHVGFTQLSILHLWWR